MILESNMVMYVVMEGTMDGMEVMEVMMARVVMMRVSGLGKY